MEYWVGGQIGEFIYRRDTKEGSQGRLASISPVIFTDWPAQSHILPLLAVTLQLYHGLPYSYSEILRLNYSLESRYSIYYH